MPRPRAGDWLADEISSWRNSGLNVVVSLLEDSEIEELELEAEEDLCRAAGLTYLRLPIPDREVPASKHEFSSVVSRILMCLKVGQGVGIHCRIGVGRSALVAACVLIALGETADNAWSTIENARGMSVPDTDEQKNWVKEFHLHTS